MKKYHHLLGIFKIGQRQQAIDLAWQQFQKLVERGELNKGKDMAYVEIRVFLVDGEKE
jgi:hypothetical protein